MPTKTRARARSGGDGEKTFLIFFFFPLLSGRKILAVKWLRTPCLLFVRTPSLCRYPHS